MHGVDLRGCGDGCSSLDEQRTAWVQLDAKEIGHGMGVHWCSWILERSCIEESIDEEVQLLDILGLINCVPIFH